MLPLLRRWLFYTVLAAGILLIIIQATYLLDSRHINPSKLTKAQLERLEHPQSYTPKVQWSTLRQQHPVKSLTALPTGPLVHIPQIQHDFEPETCERRVEREGRLAAVVEAFKHSWDGYKKHAWMQDEVAPVSGESRNGFGGWGATLVDSLDTLWIMGLHAEFDEAVLAVKNIDFTTTPQDELNIFETTIRYLGGLLSAYDVSGQKHKILLQKATSLGHMLYMAFDTPNRMPVARWNWKNTVLGRPQQASRNSLLAEVGLSLEFTRLSQLTGDNKWYDAIARIMDVFEDSQNRTKIKGLWPVFLDTKGADFTRDKTFSLGGMADSHYEHFPKQHLLLGGRSEQYRNMYATSLQAANEHLFFRPLNPDNQELLLIGTIKRHAPLHHILLPEAQHLTCFAGGMVALAAKAFSQPDELSTARQLLDGCLWAYDSMPHGIMPESFHAVPCVENHDENCTWTVEKWYRAIADPASTKNHNGVEETPDVTKAKAQATIKAAKLVPGFTRVTDARYVLRPEAIESLFVMYRITGDHTLQDKAWNMFQKITNATRTPIAYAGIKDVSDVDLEWVDTMESFWTAETLKYFYLIFSEPDVISLDDYVL